MNITVTILNDILFEMRSQMLVIAKTENSMMKKSRLKTKNHNT